MGQQSASMIDVPDAHRILRGLVRPGEVERVSLREALHRTLAEPVRCDVDYPPFDRSLMDGYAVRAEDVARPPVELRVAAFAPAGEVVARAIGPGECALINTGAPIPPGADAVVRREDTAEVHREDTAGAEERVRVNGAVGVGQNITRRAAYVSARQCVLDAGTLLTPLEIAVAASAGAAELMVYRVPRVAVLTTGNELVDVAQKLSGAAIRNSNQYLLAALVRDAHAEAVTLGVAQDELEALRSRVREGIRHDVLCITGGVSVGTLDLVPQVLEELECAVHVRKMSIKPGRPVHVAVAPTGCLVFALPGNPISAFVGFELLVRPALAARCGRTGEFPAPVRVVLNGRLAAAGARRSFLPARVTVDERGVLHAKPLSWQGSGDPFGMATANGIVVRPPGAGAAGSGDEVLVYLLRRV